MSSGHTDAQLLLMTQIAYLNIEPGPGGHPQNIKDWMDDYYKTLKNSGSDADKKQVETINNIRNMLASEEYSDLGFESWSVVDSCDHNGGKGSGMYSMLIDTGDGDAVIAFRGSESYDVEQNIKDWAAADLGLLNSPLTRQQADAQEYTKRIMEKYGDRYGQFETTGHSLGGNLAEHAALTVPAEYRDKIRRGVNFDGPGFSDEYIMTHAADIAAMSGKVDHYAWSAIGALLLTIPGASYLVIDADTPEEGLIYRHDTKNVRLKDGNVVEGERDPLAEKLGLISRQLEIGPTSLFKVQIQALILVTAIGLHVLNNGIRWIIDTFSELFGPRAEFTVQTAALSEAAQELEALASLERQIAAESMRISENVVYNSMGGYYCRNKIKNTAGMISCDAAGAGRLKTAIRSCRSRYENSDARAEQLLAI